MGEVAIETDMERNKFRERFWDESKKMWEIATPAILGAVCQFSIGFITSAFVGHLGEIELAAVSVVQNVIEGFVFGLMLGMGSALETLCGKAVGAGQFNMLGIYMQKSWIITFVTALILAPVYIFSSPILQLIHQDKQNLKRFWDESKKMWEIATPAILGAVCKFSIGFITSVFVGCLGEIELAAVSVVQNVIEGFVFGLMLGMGSALETLCGQAVGAGQFNMLGIYMQRSWIITFVTALILAPVYIFSSPILQLIHQDKQISDLAQKYSRYVIPQLFAYALNFPIQKFLQSQIKVWVMTIIAMVTLGIHALLNWILVTKLGHGLLGAAMAGNISWWIMVSAQMVYVVCGYFPEAWTGFSMLAFRSLASFVKLSLASAVMLCLELWYYTAVILIVGGLKNPTIAVDAVSICMNVQLWTLMIALGFNVAVSVRVSIELGAGNPKAAKFSVVVTTLTSTVFGIIFTIAVLLARNDFPNIFTKKPEVKSATSDLGYFLAATIFLNSIQPVLHGVAVGAGWQFMVALINIGCYYIVGLPIGAILGYVINVGVKGVWTGMLVGGLLQTVVLFWYIKQKNWSKEALQAGERVRTWGGAPPPEVEHQQTPTISTKQDQEMQFNGLQVHETNSRDHHHGNGAG